MKPRQRQAAIPNHLQKQAEYKKAMCNAAREVILMADSSKFGRKSPNIVCSLESVDKPITDAGIDPAFKKALEEKGIEVIVTGERDE
ncbi:hypothetical protein [Leclercia adecarboxylata]|uniref:hypothetical protein n=1 Tax=Leclercia adecarboxylata TaxID=83655 RepID=UPI0028FDF3BD|nr:hypothetical protein [Leclercia adecarboxylata]